MSKFLDNNGLLYFWQQIKNKFVAQEAGKGLSTNDYTTEEKNKLATIADGAEANVNADWNAVSGDAQILNKPTIPSKTSELTNDSGFITSNDIPEGAAASNTVPKMDGTATVGTELAFARGDHIHPSDTTKVDKVKGKGLSTNDLTNELKTHYDAAYTHSQSPHAPSDAQENVIETIQVNGVSQTPTGKTVNITVPTTVASLTDASNYALVSQVPTTVAQLSDASDYALKTDLSTVYKYKGSKATYAELPSTDNQVGDVWNVEEDNMNYAWTGTAWDPLGAIFEIDSITNGEIDNILAQ